MNNKIFGIPVNQNQQEFIISVFTISEILKFTKFTKRILIGLDENRLPIYNKQIQREVEKSRVEKIADFLIEDPEATFPTNLVLHIPIEVINKQEFHNAKIEGFKFLELELNEDIYIEVEKEKRKEGTGDIFITVIDGQHRIRGIEIAIERLTGEIDRLNQTLAKSPGNSDLNEKLVKSSQRLKDLLNIELAVSFFVDKSLEFQAMIFSTINRTQKRVTESLVYDLFGISPSDSPYKSALQIVYALNAHIKSPFFNRVKLYGGSYQRNQSPPLSQATMIKSIVLLISENLTREAERDRNKSRKDLFQRTPGSEKYLPFRKYYAEDKDTKISDLMFYYFNSVKETFKIPGTENSYWDFDPDSMTPTNILQTTVGYQALLDILVDILFELDKKTVNEEKKFLRETYDEYLKKASHLNILDIQRYPFTSKSRSIFYLDLSICIWPPTENEDTRVIKLNALLRRD